MKHLLPTDTINKVLNYLASKAFSEVSALINEIKSLAVQHVEPSDASSQAAPEEKSE